jgi:MraZ protein
MLSHAVPPFDCAPALTPQSSGWSGLACAPKGGLVDRFLSNFTHRFDAKGRISIPASFRQVLAKDGFAGVYAYPSLDAPALDCGGNALIAEIDSLLQTMPPYSQARDAFATALLGMSEVLRLDAEGRVFFEERLKTALGLGSEAVFVGQGHKFQIWEPARFQAHLEQARERVRRLRADRDALAPPGASG